VKLVAPLPLAGRVAPNRIVFGPHETNLAERRSLSVRHVEYYRRRAQGGCGTVVIEEASVHPSDWPYERSPLAGECGSGWHAIGRALHLEGALAIAALGHAGGQGSSAYNQRELWAPSRVPEVNSREVPKWMEAADISAVVESFAVAARLARESGLDGVEINAGQHSLVRQFLSGLTNQRDDEWGADKLLFARSVLAAVRAAMGTDLILGLRLSCDELAPWAGIVPEAGAGIARQLSEAVPIDYIAVVKGSIYTVSATRPDAHVDPGFNLDLAALVRAAVPANVSVMAQGSIVDPEQASHALDAGLCDLVEMTRAQIADPDLAGKVRLGHGATVRPCLLCNQVCLVRDPRNPVISCVVNPSAGHETDEPLSEIPAAHQRSVLVVGAGPAGLECARVAAHRGHQVRVVDSASSAGGAVISASKGSGRARLALSATWLHAECLRLGVSFEWAVNASPEWIALQSESMVILATGGSAARPEFLVAGGRVWTAAEALDAIGGNELPDASGAAVVIDDVGGPIAVSVAESLAARGHEVHLVTSDQVAGNELARTGDLAPANVRLQAAGVQRHLRSVVRGVDAHGVQIEHRFSGERTTIPAGIVVHCGHRVPNDGLYLATGSKLVRIGDAIAPRTIYEAILEGRRVGTQI
jgi:mycofactocin system FadH/OYE family oxidoreductase 1